MRIITTTIIIFILIISGSAASYNYINSTSRNLVAQLENAEKAIQDQQWTLAREQLEQTENNWDKTKYWWTILLNHHEIDNIELSSQRLKQYLINQDKTLSLAEISALEMLFEHIADTEAVNIENIL
ncbi:MAG TPA: DUF4363 family protein [Desulfitobacteriaceae bacterium]|nr:DUF4363 family protein [Desulfitobacteriaceae bacterium]